MSAGQPDVSIARTGGGPGNARAARGRAPDAGARTAGPPAVRSDKYSPNPSPGGRDSGTRVANNGIKLPGRPLYGPGEETAFSAGAGGGRTASTRPMIEQLLNYKLLEVLGRGAGSTIYRAQDLNTGRVVALKHVPRVKQKDIRYVEQMETEYEVSKSFSHPNLRRALMLKVNKSLLLKVTDAILVLEYVDAKPLERSLPSDLGEVIDVFLQAANGLQAMHRMGFAHCDIKPNNILRDDKGQVKVIDFGQACRIGTVKERIQGTPDYIAPEQVTRQPISEGTDVFNLGATLYWATTGKHIPTAYHAKRHGENSFLIDSLFKTPRDLNPDVPIPVSEVIMQCVATNPKNRPQTMDELIRKLELGRHVLQRNDGALQAQAASDPLVNDTRF